MTHKVLQLPPGALAKYTKLFLALFISGYMHAFAETATGLSLQQSGAVRFFCTQAVGIMIEDIAKEVFMDRCLKRGHTSAIFRRVLGYVWVGCFLAWSTPAWLYPDAVKGPKTPFLPFSFVKLELQ
ncbi:hypothetical protein BDV96DRAFT_683800 [Lophiotrema nucula]|uniref:Wax synthase domain-containing protein n=1 Tax=Lophiotrema nucula TaxID=690887 RepID=A0A6A5ZNA2_9PLEO|nr:hypothetical protein BDV96DRAFT_683800 [Lophiotrema nucula]